jgi:hypothetical protein
VAHAGAFGNAAQREALDTLGLEFGLSCFQQSSSQVPMVNGWALLPASRRERVMVMAFMLDLDIVKFHLDIDKIEPYRTIMTMSR